MGASKEPGEATAGRVAAVLPGPNEQCARKTLTVADLFEGRRGLLQKKIYLRAKKKRLPHNEKTSFYLKIDLDYLFVSASRYSTAFPTV